MLNLHVCCCITPKGYQYTPWPHSTYVSLRTEPRLQWGPGFLLLLTVVLGGGELGEGSLTPPLSSPGSENFISLKGKDPSSCSPPSHLWSPPRRSLSRVP
jgi:hypothetical protein